MLQYFFMLVIALTHSDHDIPSQLMAWKNRQNPNVYKAFAIVLKNEKLWVSIGVIID